MEGYWLHARWAVVEVEEVGGEQWEGKWSSSSV